MKIKLLYFITGLAIFASCKDDYTPLLDSPDKRINDTLDIYRNIFADTEQAWQLKFLTKSGDFYNFVFKFKDNNRVEMLSDISEDMATNFHESSYRLEALMRPSIIFDTYNYLHLISDPDPSVNNGERGKGSAADFSFSLLKQINDSIALYGNFNKNYAHFVKLPQEKLELIENGAWKQTMEDFKSFYSTSSFPYVQIGNSQLLVTLDTSNRKITFTPFENQVTGTKQELNYAHDIDFIPFSKSLKFKNKIFEGLYWDQEVAKFYLKDDNDKLYLQNMQTFPVDVNDYLGYGKNYTYIQINNHRLPYQINSSFNTVWNDAVAKFKTNGNRAIVYASFRFLTATEFQVIVSYATADFFGDPTTQNNFSGDCIFSITQNGNQFTLDEGVMSGNWEIHQNSLAPIRNYFANSTFIKRWVTSPSPLYNKSIMGAYQKIGNVNDFVYGIAK